MTYTFTATNTGDDPLTDIVLTDDQCANRVLVDDGNGDAILDPDEVWTWTCDTAVTRRDGEPRHGAGLDHTGTAVDDFQHATVADL